MEPPTTLSTKFVSATKTTISLVLIAGMMWSCFWGIASLHYVGLIDQWIAEGRSEGYDIRYDNRQLFGYPFKVALRFENLHWKNKDGISFKTGTIDISALPWQRYQYNTSFKHDVRIETPLPDSDQVMILSCQSGNASVTITPEGKWLESELRLEEAEFGRTPNFVAKARQMNLAISRPIPPPNDHHISGLTVAADIDELKVPAAIPSPFGDLVNKFAITAKVMGAMPDFRNPYAVKKWNDLSGIVEFERLHLISGVLDLDINGTIAFDDDLQPEGAFAGRLTEPKPVFKTLMDRGFIAQRQSSLLDTALRLFAKPSHDRTDHPEAIDLPISVQLGTLYFGPVRILSFPPIEWPVIPEGGKIE